jgi:hypothetical protein
MKASFQQSFGKTKNRASHGFLWLCGERGIRTPGPVDTGQRFSRPPHSTTLPFLQFYFKIAALTMASIPLLQAKAGPFLQKSPPQR